jgi:imidazolonepropionase-like amidohydrolase
VIKNVAVVDVKAGKVKTNRTVVIQGNRITSVSSKTIVSKDATVIDGKGKYLIPGLWDMHVHVLTDNRYDWIFSLMVANGVTGIREMGTDLPIERIIQIRSEILEQKMLGPRLGATTARILDGVHAEGSIRPGVSNPGTAIKTADEGRELVREYKRQGIDFIKPYYHLSREEYLAIVDEAKKQQIPFAGHVPYAMTAAEVSDLGQSSIEHNIDILLSSSRDEAMLRQETHKIPYNQPYSPARQEINDKALATFDEGKAVALFKRFVRNGTWMCPTIVFFNQGIKQESQRLNDSLLKYISPADQQRWRNQMKQRDALSPADIKKTNHQKRLEIVGLMQRTGVKLLAGTDILNPYVIPGFSLHEELESFVKAGLSPAEALRTATINPAIFLKATDSLGTIEKGKIADLVLLNANPLKNISNTRRIEAVIINGRLLQRRDLDTMMNQLKETMESKKQN